MYRKCVLSSLQAMSDHAGECQQSMLISRAVYCHNLIGNVEQFEIETRR